MKRTTPAGTADDLALIAAQQVLRCEMREPGTGGCGTCQVGNAATAAARDPTWHFG